MDFGSALPLPSSCWLCGPGGYHCQLWLSGLKTKIQLRTLCEPSPSGPAPTGYASKFPPNHTHKFVKNMHSQTVPQTYCTLTSLPSLISMPGDSEPPAGISRSWAQFCAICVALNKALLLSGPHFLLCIRGGLGYQLEALQILKFCVALSPPFGTRHLPPAPCPPLTGRTRTAHPPAESLRHVWGRRWWADHLHL